MSVEIHRDMAMKAIYATKTWKACWPIWKPEIDKRTSSLGNPHMVYDLGSQLRDIFFLTNTGSRSQSSVSGAGTAWECLVCWYLNLVFSGTNAVAMRQSRGLVPSVLLDATTITYGTFQTNTESDLCIVIYPDGFPFPAKRRGFKKALDLEVDKNFHAVELGIVQCKANWNDNAQVPMLWDMVYRAHFDRGTHIKIGKGGYTISHLKKFTYSFVTAPTQKKPFTPGSMPVKRTNNLSGGNYWGQHNLPGVALSISEIFTRNFGSAFKKTVPASISDAMARKVGLFA